MTYPTAAAGMPRPPRPDDYGHRGVYLDWPEFVAWLRGRKTRHADVQLPPPWKPGQHWAMIGKTREGKSNFAVAVCKETRRYVLAVDPKGEDQTLTASGWARITGVPPARRFPREIQRALDEHRPVRLIVGLDTRTEEQDAANRELISRAVNYCRESRGWTLLIDEHQVATDPRMYKIGPQVARMAVSAASAKTSVIVCMQYISWAEKTPLRQASLVSFWKSRSKALFKALAEEIGRDWQELAAISDELRKYDVATLSDDLRAPVVVTRPPKIG